MITVPIALMTPPESPDELADGVGVGALAG